MRTFHSLSASLWLTILFFFFPPVLLRIKHRPCWVSTLPLRYIPASPFCLRESYVVQVGLKLPLEQELFTGPTFQVLELQAYATMPGRNFFFKHVWIFCLQICIYTCICLVERPEKAGIGTPRTGVTYRWLWATIHAGAGNRTFCKNSKCRAWRGGTVVKSVFATLVEDPGLGLSTHPPLSSQPSKL